VKIKGLQFGTDYVPQKEGFIQVDPDKIHIIEGFNCRRFMSGIEELADNILTHGQDTPVVLNLVGDRLELVEGHRRLAAIQHINAHLLPDSPQPLHPRRVLARVVEMSQEEARQANLRENVQRDDLSPADIAYSVAKAVEAGVSRQQIALDMAISISAVNDFIKLAKLPVKVQRKLHKHRKLKSALIEVLRLPEAQWESALEDLFASDVPDLPTARQIVKLRREIEAAAAAKEPEPEKSLFDKEEPAPGPGKHRGRLKKQKAPAKKAKAKKVVSGPLTKTLDVLQTIVWAETENDGTAPIQVPYGKIVADLLIQLIKSFTGTGNDGNTSDELKQVVFDTFARIQLTQESA